MSDVRQLRLDRQQLALFLPTHDSIVEFERLFARDNELAELVLNIIEAAGLNDDGTYDPDTTAKYIAAALSLAEADSLLDTAIFDNSRALITMISGNSSLLPLNQSILAYAPTVPINITMPNPSLSFADSRSFRIGITKIDTSANIVTLYPYAAETIAGEASQTLEYESEVLNFITDGTNWHLLN